MLGARCMLVYTEEWSWGRWSFLGWELAYDLGATRSKDERVSFCGLFGKGLYSSGLTRVIKEVYSGLAQG